MAVRFGKVHFAKEPYYRNITEHPIGRRTKLGDQQCLTDFDEYRWGLEILAFDLFNGHLTPEVKAVILNGIHQFIFARVEVASRILLAQNRIAEANLYEKRMAITGASPPKGASNEDDRHEANQSRQESGGRGL